MAVKGNNIGDTSRYIGKTGAIERCSAYSRAEGISCAPKGFFLAV